MCICKALWGALLRVHYTLLIWSETDVTQEAIMFIVQEADELV